MRAQTRGYFFVYPAREGERYDSRNVVYWSASVTTASTDMIPCHCPCGVYMSPIAGRGEDHRQRVRVFAGGIAHLSVAIPIHRF